MLLQPSNPSRRRPTSRRASRGFTLIELITVVLIIGIMAALATPSIARQMRDRRARQLAQRTALLYNNARMRALGRGSAVLVRYRSDTGFTVLESIDGAAVAGANCAARPGRGCLSNNWTDVTTQRNVGTLVPDGTDMTVWATAQDDTTVTKMDICFTPIGRSFISFDGSSPTAPMAGATMVHWGLTGAKVADRQAAAQGVALERLVAILPNGMARLAL